MDEEVSMPGTENDRDKLRRDAARFRSLAKEVTDPVAVLLVQEVLGDLKQQIADTELKKASES
jgi:hypothetical protein